MKQGTYIARSLTKGSVMFRINGKPYTIRKGSDLEVEIQNRDTVSFPKGFMELTLKGATKSEPKQEAKEEIVEPKEEVVVEPKTEEVKTEEVKTEEVKTEEVKEEAKTTKRTTRRGRKKSVKIETEEK